MAETTGNWAVYTYQTVNGKLECHIIVAFDNSADDLAHVPFTQAAAQEYAEQVNFGTAQHGIAAMALPCEETLQPGV